MRNTRTVAALPTTQVFGQKARRAIQRNPRLLILDAISSVAPAWLDFEEFMSFAFPLLMAVYPDER
jgi:hypothetical protein